MVATKKAKYTIFHCIIEELKKSDSSCDDLKQARTLAHYLQDGLITAALCSAGSFYMLILMSCSRIKAEVRKLNGPMCGRVAKLIHCPPGECFIIVFLVQVRVSDLTCWTETAMGRKVKRQMIPAVTHLCQFYPISLKMILPLESLGLGHLTGTINCQDIQSCDDIFDSFLDK